MKIIQSSDYRIYIDDVRVDQYVKNWSAGCGLYASDATANITMYYTKKLKDWKAYLAQVRIFALNPFKGKYDMCFEGEITGRSFSDQRTQPGQITFNCKGFYHWLDTPIPMIINQQDQLDEVQRFKYEAQNINVDAVEAFKTEAQQAMKNFTIEQIINKLFDMLYEGYYMHEDSSFEWANMKKRIRVMGDISEEFRNAGYLDVFTFMQHTSIQSFYVYLNTILSQMMFEFYQDRDGALRIKNPSWSDQILKGHILDESVVQSISGFNEWENEPTRVLVIGGESDIQRFTAESKGAANVLKVPMGLYIGKPGEGEYFSRAVQVDIQAYGDSDDYSGGGGGAFFDDLNGNYPITSKYHQDRGSYTHKGVDLGMPTGTPLHNQGVGGKVFHAGYSSSAGNWVQIEQNINGVKHHFVYMHLSEIKVKTGDNVTSGQVIGLSGNTGNSTGPHLHFEVWIGGARNTSGSKETDPLKFLKDMGKKMGGSGGGTATGDVAEIRNMDLGYSGGYTAAQLNSWINKNAKSGSKMRNQGQAFADGGKQYGINPVYLVAHAAHETGWGTSSIVKNKNNFYGIGAFDNDPYNGAKKWGSAAAGIKGGAQFVRNDYYDRGQKTLYQMRHSKDGKHNYATDPQWDVKIAKTMKASGLMDKMGSSSGGEGSARLASNPYATTGGFSASTSLIMPKGGYLAEQTAAKQKENQKKQSSSKPKVPLSYPPTKIVEYFYPSSASSYRSYIRGNPNGVPANMIASIIKVSSNWKEKSSTDKRFGLMGLTEGYIKDRLGNNVNRAYNPIDNIDHGTKLFKAAYDRFRKVTAAIAAVYLGNMIPVETAITAAKTKDWMTVRNKFENKKVASFVDDVINSYVDLYDADYINGDPHMAYLNVAPGDIRVIKPIPSDTKVEDYSMYYKPLMSDEERLYKVSLKIFEQNLIRDDMDSSGQAKGFGSDELVEMFAKYMMQLYRAQSHSVTVSLSTCLPYLRPGFNMWLEPTRTNVVFYCTRVSHQGVYGQGAFSSVTGAFLRSPGDYDDIEDNIFVGKTFAEAKDYGAVIKKADMNKMRTTLVNLHNSSAEAIHDAKSVPTLSGLYGSAQGVIDRYSTIWSTSMGADELDKNVKEVYKDAPQIVKKRKSDFAKIIAESKDQMTSLLMRQSY